MHAHVLLPKGYAEHPNDVLPERLHARSRRTPLSFSTNPPRQPHRGGINPVTGLESGYDDVQAVERRRLSARHRDHLEQQTPYFPDSYSVNSANNGPYGDAIVEESDSRAREALPHHPQAVRAAARGRVDERLADARAAAAKSRLLRRRVGASSPTRSTSRATCSTNIYADTNAFVLPRGPFTTIERPFQRTTRGPDRASRCAQLSRFEAVLGSRGPLAAIQLERVGGGLRSRRRGRLSGAALGQAHRHDRPQRREATCATTATTCASTPSTNWSTIGPKLAGKLHFFDAATWTTTALNLAVYKFEEFLKSDDETRTPTATSLRASDEGPQLAPGDVGGFHAPRRPRRSRRRRRPARTLHCWHY